MEGPASKKRKASASFSTNVEPEPHRSVLYGFHIDCAEAWTFLVKTLDICPAPGQVFLLAEGKKFSVHENILVKHSSFFEHILNNPFRAQSQKKIITFDDVKAVHLGIYLNMIYCQAFGQFAAVPTFGEPEHCIWFPAHVEIYQLCIRFCNRKLAATVFDGIRCYLVLDPDRWPDAHMSDKEETFSAYYIKGLSECFKLLDPANRFEKRLRGAIVYSICHCSPIAITQDCLNLIRPNNQDLVFEVASRWTAWLRGVEQGDFSLQNLQH
ncbi:hypothetical protein K4K54_000026 [Colletotrichum sp. SAR 10_86]|nr:hypothetical protein K4K52_003126 [Colletotrichum sp. SAR 10_76]KAI8238413.1 hypothetical protein K4K54_000026 [Colletotrichum sp. SAR 10_86]